MIAARRREREYFANTPEYKHLAHRMGSEHLAKMLSKVSIGTSFSDSFLLDGKSNQGDHCSVIFTIWMVNYSAFGKCNQVQNSGNPVPY